MGVNVEANPLGGGFVASVADASGEGLIGVPRSVILAVDAIGERARAVPSSASAPAAQVVEQPGQARLEDRGVRGVILCISGDRTQTQIDLPLSFASIEREGATLSITVHKDVHPDCEHGGKPIYLTCTEGAAEAAESWKREMDQAVEKVNTKHWGASKSFIREQRDSWAAEGRRCKGMSVAEYFIDIGLGHVYDDTWSWCVGVLEGLEAKEGKSVADAKEIAYYRRKVEKTEVYEDMELTDYMNILKHRDLVPAKRMVSYADFIHAEVDSTGRRKVSEATVFVSHVWKMTTKDFFEVCLAEMVEEDYAWIDLYLHNQYQGAVSTIGDENSEYWVKKFGELIGGIGKVIAIVTDWESPVMLTRIWCLFELNAAIDTGAALRFVASSAQRMDLMLNLQEKFKYLSAIVQNIEVRNCDAKRPHEIQDKAVFLSKLAGVEDEVNDKLRKAMQLWLAETAQGVLARTDPSREPLGPVEMELEVVAVGEGSGCWCCVSGAKATRLVERRPKLPVLLFLLGGSGALATVVIDVLGVLGASHASSDEQSISIAANFVGLMLLVFAPSVSVMTAGSRLQKHQRQRGLRPAPPLLGACAVRHRRTVVGAVFVLSVASFPPVVRFTFPWSAQDEENGAAQGFSFSLATALTVVLTFLVHFSLGEDVQTAVDRASLAVNVGWLRLRLGGEQQLTEAEQIFLTAHEELQRQLGPGDPQRSLLAAPGLARSRCDLARTVEAQAVVAQVQSAVERSSNRCTAPAVRWYTNHYYSGDRFLLLCWCAVTLLSWWVVPARVLEGDAALAFILCVLIGLIGGGFLCWAVSLLFERRVGWEKRGALWRALVAAAARAPDATVLGLLTETAHTKFGQTYLLDGFHPELADFLQRMAAAEGAETDSIAEDRAAWRALPPRMRAAGDNALSPWERFTHETHTTSGPVSRSYYRNYRTLETTLVRPLEGVCFEGVVGMRGMVLRGEGRWEKLPGLSLGKERWESEYFDLEGPGRWSAQQQNAYKRKVLAIKLAWAALFTGVLVLLFCQAFVYVDCSGHGSWGFGGCHCVGGYKGERCDLTASPLLGMAEAYIVSGAVNERYNGRYVRLAAECNGKPVYQRQAALSGWYVLFQPTDTSNYWYVGTGEQATSCDASGYVTSAGAGGICPSSPDGSGCVGRWQELVRHEWQNAPSLAVARWCPDDNPCCGIDCGEHGTLADGGRAGGMASCGCRCTDGYTGDRCAMVPLPAGMAEAYIVSGAVDEQYNGRYVRLAAECNGKPVYQRQAALSGWYVLFQPTDTSNYWYVGNSEHATDCEAHGYLRSQGGGICPSSPDGSGCVGRWQEWDGHEWQNAPSLAVVSG